jgi:aryl-phospho-beta-D-glucosidase BglC (GH1 family)
LLARLTRGVNISRWFRYPAQDAEQHYRGFITDADLDLLVVLGVTCVRLAVDPRYLNLTYLDEAVARLMGRGLAVVLDYHDESREIETGPAAVDALERAWAALAAHFAPVSPDVLLLEIFNEPVFDGDAARWFPIRRRLAAAIRAAAPLHTIVAGGPNWSSLDGLLASRPLEDTNVLYTFHFYEPFEFTHQGAPWVQGPVARMRNVRYPATPQQARHVERRIASAAEWARRHNVPVWAGEFGAYPPYAPKNDRLRWLYDVRTALDRHGIGWALWSYDESLGLDRVRNETGALRVDWDSVAALGLRAAGAVA